jgi:hypothetical protein
LAQDEQEFLRQTKAIQEDIKKKGEEVENKRLAFDAAQQEQLRVSGENV